MSSRLFLARPNMAAGFLRLAYGCATWPKPAVSPLRARAIASRTYSTNLGAKSLHSIKDTSPWRRHWPSWLTRQRAAEMAARGKGPGGSPSEIVRSHLCARHTEGMPLQQRCGQRK
ncbi:hypothetical protein AAFF_G00258700 [Aldrovandia affinis]|uniref:Uncharacterized protein n=1 Tax=Aldrovandia affinis TaxID=143900 RepID=A0AAD7SV95_9TELE|nr:hypothetical protein AAFF_G00258700 [Aldrovandia affinis]